MFLTSKPNTNNIIIPVSDLNTDLATSIGYCKNKLKNDIIKIQKLGNSVVWDDTNSNRSALAGLQWA